MRLFSTLALLLQASIVAHAQRGGKPSADDNPNPGTVENLPKPNPDPGSAPGVAARDPYSKPPKPNPDPGSAPAVAARYPYSNPPKPNPDPGSAPAVAAPGPNSNLPKHDNEVDIGKIGDALKDLIENLNGVVVSVDNSTASTPDTALLTDATLAPATITASTAIITDATSAPASATPCFSASEAYSLCSSNYTNFSDLPKTQQASCLCHANTKVPFNGEMESCYSFV